jgi:WD40-like Beta Propeller Repeat
VIRPLAIALVAAFALPAAAGALEPPDPDELGVLAFTSLRCEQGGQPFNLPYPNKPSWPVCNQGIFRVNADGTHLKRLTGTTEDTMDTQATWSPDGSKIAFVRRYNSGFYSKLMVMDSNGSNEREMVADAPEQLNPFDPSWSPRGDQVLFDAIGGIYTVDVVTGQLRHVEIEGFENGKDPVGQPVFSPDGLRIAFLGMHGSWDDFEDVHDTDFGIWIANADGSDPERLTLGGVFLTSNGFAISPDWRYVAFMPADQPDDVALWTMKLDGSEFTRRTDVDFADDPVFSPFGPTLFFKEATGQDQHYILRRVDLAKGGPSTPVTDAAAQDSQPAWNPLGLELPPIKTDGKPPVVVLGPEVGVPPAATRAKTGGAKAPDRLPFMAIDRSGVKRVDVALARRKDGRCRFLQGSKLGLRKRCGKPVYFRYRGNRRWRAKLRGLAAGRYVVRFRTTDAKGNRTKDAKPRVVHLH